MRPILRNKPRIARGCVPQKRLQFEEGYFDRIQVGRIGRQIKELCTCRFDSMLNVGDFMHRQIVHYEDVWGKALH
jgi:hypothetical protein